MKHEGAVWPDGYGRRILQEVGSTLDEGASLAPGLDRPEWILALKQTKARGRRGRVWANPDGNFSATLVLFPDEPPAIAALRSFVAALALRDACVAVTGGAESFSLKWPNDVLLNDGKLAGILLESSGHSDRLGYLLIGIGVNFVATPPPESVEPGALRPVSLLSETGLRIDPEIFLTHLAVAYAAREAAFVRFGFAPIREAWLAAAARLGQVITARTGAASRTGRFETVDAAGNLILQTGQGRVAIPAAEVFF